MDFLHNIEWYKDEELSIFFSRVPSVGIRYLCPAMTKRERMSIKKYPFMNDDELKVVLIDYKKNKRYQFTIPAEYCFDGASIPRAFWRLVGSPTDNTFLIGAMIHDTICEHHNYVENDRNFSSRVFRALLRAGGVGFCKAQTMYLAVDNFQRFCKWGKQK